MSDEYTCEMCGGRFGKTWTDDEVLAECEQYFGVVAPEDRVVVCDDCYQAIHPANHPTEVVKARKP